MFIFTAQSVFAAEILLASLGGAHDGADNGGAIVMIDQSTGAATVLDIPMPGYSLPGLAADSNGRVFAVTSTQQGLLIEIDPETGSLLNNVGNLTYNGNPISFNDISFQPGTDILFGSVANGNLSPSALATIDTSTAVVSLVGTPAYNGGGWVAIAFAPDGTLWAKCTNAGNLWTLDPSNANILTSTIINPAIGSTGLAVRPSDGILFLSECCDDFITPGSLGNDIFTLNSSTGNAVYIGPAGGTRRVHDFAFVDDGTAPTSIPTINEWGMIVFSLILAGSAVWFLRRRTNNA